MAEMCNETEFPKPTSTNLDKKDDKTCTYSDIEYINKLFGKKKD